MLAPKIRQKSRPVYKQKSTTSLAVRTRPSPQSPCEGGWLAWKFDLLQPRVAVLDEIWTPPAAPPEPKKPWNHQQIRDPCLHCASERCWDQGCSDTVWLFSWSSHCAILRGSRMRTAHYKNIHRWLGLKAPGVLKREHVGSCNVEPEAVKPYAPYSPPPEPWFTARRPKSPKPWSAAVVDKLLNPNPCAKQELPYLPLNFVSPKLTPQTRYDV